jgi:putative nucleotidyltransferase with HDIG domain
MIGSNFSVKFKQRCIKKGEADMIELEAVREKGINEDQAPRREKKTGLIGRIKGKYHNIIFGFSEWKRFQREIKVFPNRVKRNQQKILDALSDYRLTFAQLDYKSEKIDQEVWKKFRDIELRIPNLNKRTFTRWLALRSRSWLSATWRSWKELIHNQEDLTDFLSEAPEKLIFYNNMQSVREQQKIEKIKEEENAKIVAQARQSLEHVMSQIEEKNKGLDEVTYGSKILRLDQAQDFWSQKFNEYLHVDKLNDENTEMVLENIQWLQEIVRDAPVLARGVRAVEEKYNHLIATHDMLLSYGSSVIPASEITRTSGMLNEEIPQLWINGKFDELDHLIQSINKFIEYYDLKVQTELSLAERRRPGLTQALNMHVESRKNGYSGLIAMARSLVTAVDLRDKFMRGHSNMVSELALRIAKHMGWESADLNKLELAALLHDVGKLSVPETILTKEAPLSPHEWTVIQTHPVAGAEIIKSVEPLKDIIPWVYHHQERWDGNGYPDGLSKKDIPQGSSIISLAEAFTVMRTGMPHIKAMAEDEALGVVDEESSQQFDPEVVDAFLDLMGE